MKPTVLLTIVTALATAQRYQLQSHFPGATFLDHFDFYTSWDPTYGYVHYVDRPTAEQHGMISYTPNTTRWGVEATQVLDPSANLGRLSLRLQSKQSWTHGLFVLDLAHMPSNVCGAWPAWWTVGSGTWPSTGEIDIVEFTNNGPANLIAMHTLPGCSIAGAHMSGQLEYNDCNQGAGYTGCAVRSRSPHGSGAQFNVNGGGVYVMEWTSRWVRVWFFQRGYVPESIVNAEDTAPPDTSTFGIPVANFEGSCDLDQFLFNHTMVYNTDFCGSYAGNVFGLQGCPMTDPDNAWSSCNQYVALNPGAFTEVYWEVNFLKVYQDKSGWVPGSSVLSSAVPAASTSSVSTLSSNAQGRPTTPTMSLAGTTPTDISGTFTATSSALGVLSSLSTASEAGASSSLATALSPPPSSTTGGLPFTSPTGQGSSSASPVAPPPTTPSVAPLSPASPSSSPASAPEGVTFVTIVIQETVTVHPTPTIENDSKHQRRSHLRHEVLHDRYPRRQADAPTPWTTAISTTINEHGNCGFIASRTGITTDFICTFTKLGLLSGSFYTNRITFSTAAPATTGLTLLTFLTIDTFSLQTQTLDGAALGVTFTAVAGSFTPIAASIASTTLTGYPVAADQGTTGPSPSGSSVVSTGLAVTL